MGVIGPDMTEHAVQENPQAALFAGRGESIEIFVPAQSRVDAELVQGVVPVGFGGEDRPQQQSRGPNSTA